MSTMSSAQIVSAGSAIHNKMPSALIGHLALHASTPVSYPGAVSPLLTRKKNCEKLRVFFCLLCSVSHMPQDLTLIFLKTTCRFLFRTKKISKKMLFAITDNRRLCRFVLNVAQFNGERDVSSRYEEKITNSFAINFDSFPSLTLAQLIWGSCCVLLNCLSYFF